MVSLLAVSGIDNIKVYNAFRVMHSISNSNRVNIQCKQHIPHHHSKAVTQGGDSSDAHIDNLIM